MNNEDLQGQLEALDLENHRMRRAVAKLMSRLTVWLDDDQFNEAEEILHPEFSPDPKPLDDPKLQQLFGDAIWGAYLKGRERSDPPPDGHWLTRWWHWGSINPILSARSAVDAEGWISVETRLPETGVAVLVYEPSRPDDWPGTLRIFIDHISEDYEDWHSHCESYEHFMAVGGRHAAGPDTECTGPSEKAPYTHWRAIPAAPGPASPTPAAGSADRLAQALRRIIAWNRNHARDQYGDENLAEGFSCVREAREALGEALPAPHVGDVGGARDAERYRAVKARHAMALVHLVTDKEGYSSVTAPGIIDAWADAAVREVNEWDAMTTDQRADWWQSRLDAARAAQQGAEHGSN